MVLCTWLMISSLWPVGLYKSRWIYSAPLKISLLHIPYHNTMSALPRGMYGVMKNDSVALLSAYKSFSIQGSDGKERPRWSHRRERSGALWVVELFFQSSVMSESPWLSQQQPEMCSDGNISDAFSESSCIYFYLFSCYSSEK